MHFNRDCLELLPKEVKQKIFLYFSHKNAEILVDAFWHNRLQLKHIYVPNLSYKVWNELRPSYLESNTYGSGMYIIRKRITVTERMLLLT